MAKIHFDIKYRPEIEAGKYKVKVEEHEARIVCWDYNGDNLIVCVKFDGGEQGLIYDTAGRHMSKLPEREPDLELYTDEPELTVEDLKKAVESGGALPIWLADAFHKKYFEGYVKGQEDAEKRHREATSFHYGPFPSWPPPCFVGGPCTNPHHDCINCHHPGTSGIAKTDTNIK